jgi:hypothetical protein
MRHRIRKSRACYVGWNDDLDASFRSRDNDTRRN